MVGPASSLLHIVIHGFITGIQGAQEREVPIPKSQHGPSLVVHACSLPLYPFRPPNSTTCMSQFCVLDHKTRRYLGNSSSFAAGNSLAKEIMGRGLRKAF
jgi:hypothetical protein